MSQQFYDIAKAAEVLGLKPADVQLLREQNKLRGFRDGASWKFKVDDIQNYLAESIKAKGSDEADEDGDFVIGGEEPQAGGNSDLELGGSDLDLTETEFELAGSDIDLSAAPTDSAGSDLELDLTLDQDVSLGESDIALASEEKVDAAGSDLEVSADVLDDDELVLGGSGAGSDITIGGDSGISLVDPDDSGLSLEAPVDLTGDDEDSLELGEDDMLTLTEDADTESPTELQADDQFLLTPLEEAGDEESGSQVIALDTEDDAAMAAVAAAPAMLDEELGGGADQLSAFDGADLGGGAPMVDMAAAAAATGNVAAMPTGAGMQEAPYSGMVVWLGLFPCTLMLVLAGLMSFDLVRNMWDWQGATTINSPLLDMIAGILFK
jgi:hypothetical protein